VTSPQVADTSAALPEVVEVARPTASPLQRFQQRAKVCIEKAQRRAELPASAKLTVRLSVAARGSVDSLELTPSTGALSECLAGAARAQTWPTRSEPYPIVVPIVVRAGESIGMSP
jgi:hypothetical protein